MRRGAAGEKTKLIVREREPGNLEYPFEQLSAAVGVEGRLTANEMFYVRSHFAVPQVDLGAHRLSVEGCVEKAFSVSVEELRAMPAVRRVATVECAGNGRAFLEPAVKGVQWGLGAVGTAEWTGVPLSALLKRAGVKAGALEIVLEGADRGRVVEGEIEYARSVGMGAADSVLIAYAMNGEAITEEHGAPLRAVVQGHYGMASVKWLTKVRVVDEVFRGYWQTSDYAYWKESAGQRVLMPLGEMALKSSIARPRAGEVVRVGERYEVFGAAWTGGAAIAMVEVSVDGGKTWGPAEILDADEYGVWRRWRFMWEPKGAGECVLMSCATDVEGKMQAAAHDKNYGSYVINHTVRIAVMVR